ncbi:hypothetical protein VCHENC02_4459, partial [Vibrio harveyi]
MIPLTYLADPRYVI